MRSKTDDLFVDNRFKTVNDRKSNEEPRRTNRNPGNGHGLNEREKAGTSSLPLEIPKGQIPLEVHAL
ncbi:MAG: hypothetical protein U5K69_24540 [Balneolaceae bacterium]|nr:hypothetical protein [Balneolaceae bacterium]